MKRRIFAIVLALVMVVSMTGGSAYAIEGSGLKGDEEGIIGENISGEGNGTVSSNVAPSVEDAGDLGVEGEDNQDLAGVPMLFALNDRFEVDGITYKEVGAGKVRLMSGRKCSGNLQIPEWVKKPGTEDLYQVVSIEDRAFAANKNLTGISFPGSITYIGVAAFDGCSGLTGDLVLPDGLTGIENMAFYGCSGLNGELRIPDGVGYIGESAFDRCTNLSGSLVLPEGVASVGLQAFYSCSSLTGDLVLPDSVKSIGVRAFQNCSGLGGRLVLSGNLESIGQYAFSGCTGFVDEVALPDSLREVGGYAFYGCSFVCEATQEVAASVVYNSQYRNVKLNGVPYSSSGVMQYQVNGLIYDIDSQ